MLYLSTVRYIGQLRISGIGNMNCLHAFLLDQTEYAMFIHNTGQLRIMGIVNMNCLRSFLLDQTLETTPGEPSFGCSEESQRFTFNCFDKIVPCLFSFSHVRRAFLFFTEIEHCLQFMLLVCSSRSRTKAFKAKRFASVAELQQLIRGASCVNFLLKLMNSSRFTIHIVEICNSQGGPWPPLHYTKLRQ